MRKEHINAIHYAVSPRKALRKPYITLIGLEVPVNINDLALNYALILKTWMNCRLKLLYQFVCLSGAF
jgi:hypothetical protein